MTGLSQRFIYSSPSFSSGCSLSASKRCLDKKESVRREAYVHYLAFLKDWTRNQMTEISVARSSQCR